MTKKLIVSFILLTIAFVSCNQQVGSEKAALKASSPNESLSFMEDNCYSCHHPSAGENERLAPPMAAVKKHYLKDHPNRAEFVSAWVNFMLDPKESEAKMKGAVKKFGLMPKMAFDSLKLAGLANYIYDNEIEAPEWFEEHYRKNHGKGGGKHGEHGGHHGEGEKSGKKAQQDPLQSGKSLAMQTKKVLGKNLMGALAEGGPVHALDFCNVRAIHLTDSMAERLQAKIVRRSDQPRNSANQANEEELSIIKDFKQQLADSGEIRPRLVELENTTIGFYPITTNQMCLQCHGKVGEDISPETLAQIVALYPEDKAVGYAANQLRGIWRVEMEKL
jgi:cytochrome c553